MSNKTKNPLTWILVGAITVLILFVGIFSHVWTKNQVEEKYRQHAVEVDLRTDVRMDSLRGVELRLRNSLDSLRRERTELVVIRTVFKTVYDTVQIKVAPMSIVSGLNAVAALPIPDK